MSHGHPSEVWCWNSFLSLPFCSGWSYLSLHPCQVVCSSFCRILFSFSFLLAAAWCRSLFCCSTSASVWTRSQVLQYVQLFVPRAYRFTKILPTLLCRNNNTGSSKDFLCLLGPHNTILSHQRCSSRNLPAPPRSSSKAVYFNVFSVLCKFQVWFPPTGGVMLKE